MFSLRQIQSQLARCTLFAVAMSVFSCAHQIPPEGGPRDVEGPEIVASYPAPFTTHFDDDRVEFEFDEYVDQRSFEESVFISPTIRDVEFLWSGTSVEMIFEEKLRDSTTYVITVGTDVTDLLAQPRNRMAQAFTLAFSTGQSIDRGLLAGRVFPLADGDDPSGIMVLAYRLDGARFDTLNPQVTLPTYVTQTGAGGSFRLPHVRLGSYAVMAERDEYRNVLYDREADEYAVYQRTIRLTNADTAQSSLILQLSKEDTTGPRIAKLDPKDRNHVAVEFTEVIDTSTSRRLSAVIIDTTTRKDLSVYAFIPHLPGRKSATLVTDFQTPETAYAVRLQAVYDTVGNEGREEGLTRVFVASDKIDSTVTHVLSLSVRDSARRVGLTGMIQLAFSDPIIPATFDGRGIRLTSSEGSIVAVTTTWLTPALVGIRPTRPLAGLSWYALSLLFAGAQDWKNTPIRDSALTVHFETMDPDEAGSVEGRVADDSPTDTAGTIVVTAVEVGTKLPQRITTRAGRDGRFTVEGLPQSRMVLSAYRDRNNNGRYDPGLPYPFQPSERRSDVSDTLKIRVRWPLEGVVLTIPK